MSTQSRAKDHNRGGAGDGYIVCIYTCTSICAYIDWWTSKFSLVHSYAVNRHNLVRLLTANAFPLHLKHVNDILSLAPKYVIRYIMTIPYSTKHTKIS